MPQSLIACFIVLASVGASCSDGRDSREVPTLGRDIGFNGALGFGEVEPPEIGYGGVPTGRVFDIEWQSWGSDEAIGHGTGYMETAGGGAASSVPRRATVIAFGLGDCDGDPAYLDVRWFFEEDGDKIDLSGPAAYNICDGP